MGVTGFGLVNASPACVSNRRREPADAGGSAALQPPEIAAAFELARRGRPGWWSFCLGNAAVFIIEPSLLHHSLAIGLTVLNLLILAIKGTLMIRWPLIYKRDPAAAIRAFAVLSAAQSSELSFGVAAIVLAHQLDAYGFVAILGALACAQAAVVAQCPHLKIMRLCVAAYLSPAAIAVSSLGGVPAIGAALLLTAELVFLLYQGAQMHDAYWRTLRENRELALAREQADQANRSKSQFLARVSHELRTPIHGVMGMTSLVLDSSIDDEQRDNLETAHHSAAGLLELVNHLLDLNKIEANRVELEQIPFLIEDVLSQVVKPLRPAAREKGVELRLESTGRFSGRVIGDPLRLRQILTNLVGNALKFTERGSVRLSATADRLEEGRIRLEVRVIDTGIGIPADKLDRIFDPFRQADAAVSRQYGGTGLGLSIARNLAELMGGTVEVERTGSEGSVFRFVCELPEAGQAVPMVAAAVRENPASTWRPARALRILVADDSPVNRRLAQKQLVKWGHAVTTAKDGIESVRLTMAGARYDLILMDVLMPGLDGTGAAEQLRRLGVSTPIVAVTANALELERRQCLDAGMNGVLAKPFTGRQLFDTVEAFGNPAI